MNVGSDSQKAFLLFAPCERSSTRKKKKTAAAAGASATAGAGATTAVAPAAPAASQPSSPAGVAAAAALIRTAQYVRTLSRPAAPAGQASAASSSAAVAGVGVDASAAPQSLAPGPSVDHDDDDFTHVAADEFDASHDHGVHVDADEAAAVDQHDVDVTSDAAKRRPRPRTSASNRSAAPDAGASPMASDKGATGSVAPDDHTAAVPKRRTRTRSTSASVIDDTLDGMAALGVATTDAVHAPAGRSSTGRNVPSSGAAAGAHLGVDADPLQALPPATASGSGTVIRRKPRAKAVAPADTSEHPLLAASIAGAPTAPVHATAPVSESGAAEPATARPQRARKAPPLTPVAASDALGLSAGIDVLAAAPPATSSLPRGSSITRRKVTAKLADAGAAATVVSLPGDGLQYPLAPGSGHSHRSMRTLNSSRLVWSMHEASGMTNASHHRDRQPSIGAAGAPATAFVRPLATTAAAARSPSTGSMRMHGLPSLRSAPQSAGYALTMLPAGANRNDDGVAAGATGGATVQAAAFHGSPAAGSVRRFPASGSAASSATKWSHIDASSCGSDSDASRQLFYSSSSESDAESVTWLLDRRGRPISGTHGGASAPVAGVASRAASAAASAAAGGSKATTYSSSSDDEFVYGSDSDDATALTGGSYYPPGASERLFFQDADAAAAGLQAPMRRGGSSAGGAAAGKRKGSSGKPDPIALAQAAAAEAAKRQFDARAFVAALNAAPKTAALAPAASAATDAGSAAGDAAVAKKPRKKKADGTAADASAQPLAVADGTPAADAADGDRQTAASSQAQIDVPAMIIDAQKELEDGASGTTGATALSAYPDDDDHWPPFRQYKIDNVDGYIEPGKKVAKKHRDITLVGLGMPPVALTDAGWPAVSSSVLRALAGECCCVFMGAGH